MTKRHHVPLSAIGKQARIVTPELVEQGRRKAVSGFTLVLPCKFPTLNEILRVKANRWRGTWNSLKIKWQDEVRRHWEDFGKPRIVGPYTVEYEYLCANKRSDPSNIAAGAEKIILDALVNAGALPGDGFKWHSASSYKAIHDGKRDAVKVTFRALAESF